MALNEWSYSDNAVVAVIDEDFEVPDTVISNEVKGTLSACKIYNEPASDVKQTNSINPVFHEFDVGDGYKYIEAEAWWDGILLAGIMIPTGNVDMQLYCKKDDKWMQSAAAFLLECICASWTRIYAISCLSIRQLESRYN